MTKMDVFLFRSRFRGPFSKHSIFDVMFVILIAFWFVEVFNIWGLLIYVFFCAIVADQITEIVDQNLGVDDE